MSTRSFARHTRLIGIITFLLFVLLSSFSYVAQSESASARVRIEEMIADFPMELREVATIEPRALLKSHIKPQTILLVDVRTEVERAVSIIPNAISLHTYYKRGDKKTPAVAYCTIGYRSAVETKRLRAEGFPISNLRGGILLWAQAGGPLLKIDGTPTKKVHVYAEEWNLLPTDYIGVW